MSEELGQVTVSEVDEGSLESLSVRHALDSLRSEQNLLAAVAGGACGALIGAALWAVVTVFTGYQIGFMAIGVGFLAGIGTRMLGKGVDSVFGVVGAALGLVGCLIGNLLAVVGLVAKQEELGFLDLLSRLDFGLATELMTATFTPMDLLFYAIAIYEGYKFSFRQVTPSELGISEEAVA